MAIPRPPTTYRCLDCGWSARLGTCSDALVDGWTHFTHCPLCNGSNVTSEPTASTWTAALHRLLDALPGFGRR